jgi:hypothetical protein
MLVIPFIHKLFGGTLKDDHPAYPPVQQSSKEQDRVKQEPGESRAKEITREEKKRRLAKYYQPQQFIFLK